MTYVELLIDTSGSMGTNTNPPNTTLLPDNSRRISFVKRLLKEEILPVIDYSSKIVVRTFNGVNTDPKPCKEIYNGKFDLPELIKSINSISDDPFGTTPITAAITNALLSLRNHPNFDRKIILITDGEEDQPGNFKEAAVNYLYEDGIFCQIFIIGIELNIEAEKKARALSTLANGRYTNLKPQSLDDRECISKGLSSLKLALRNSTSIEEKKLTVEQTETKQEDKEYIQQLLSEIEKLKEQVRANTLSLLGIDSTTLTIDPGYSEQICRKSETFVYNHLCSQYGQTKVNWLNKEGESKRNHDFELFDDTGKISRLIECKGTKSQKPTFYLSPSEWKYFLGNTSNYQVYRVFNTDGEMEAFCIENLYEAIMQGEVVPYLVGPEVLEEKKVYLTLLRNTN